MKPTKSLEETVDLMLSVEEDDRFKAEYYQLENRFIAMNDLLMNWDLGRLDPEPKGGRFQYGELLGHMRNYLNSLKAIAKVRDIKL